MSDNWRLVEIKIDSRMLEKATGGIWSASFCERTGVPARWSKRARAWVCQIHRRTNCVATFWNQSWLDREAKQPEIHPNWPTKKDIAEHKKLLKGSRIYHKFDIWIQEELNLEQWIKLDNAVSKAVDKLGIKHTHVAGPIPEGHTQKNINKIVKGLDHHHM